MKRLYLMITITNRVMGSKRFVDFYRAFGAPVVFTALGRGTASDEVLSYLGLEATEKSVMLSVVTPACKEVLMKELVSTMHLTNPGTGIAMCLPLSSIGGRTAMNYLITGNPEAEPDVEVKEDESMKDAAYQLIVAIANQGYTDTVMGAARSAGAHGGTILHAKSTGAEDAGKFFGMSIAEERETLHALLVLESGKLNGHNAFEVDSLINYLTFFLEQAKCEQDAILRDTTGGKGFYAVVRQPLGVVVASLAWNFPLHNAATKLGPILASGCTAVIKPATKTPLSTLYLGRILDRIDFPKGVINLVAGDAGEISKTLSSSRIPAMLTMIGSTQGGLEMLRDSATSVKRFSMELGGNAPVIVTPNADLKEAAAHTVGNLSLIHI